MRKEHFSEASVIYGNLQTWAWIWLIVGIIQIATAIALTSGGGRFMGILVSAGSAVVAFLSLDVTPSWSLVILAANVLVIYHLAKDGGSGHGVPMPGSIAPDQRTAPPPIR